MWFSSRNKRDEKKKRSGRVEADLLCPFGLEEQREWERGMQSQFVYFLIGLQPILKRQVATSFFFFLFVFFLHCFGVCVNFGRTLCFCLDKHLLHDFFLLFFLRSLMAAVPKHETFCLPFFPFYYLNSDAQKQWTEIVSHGTSETDCGAEKKVDWISKKPQKWQKIISI